MKRIYTIAIVVISIISTLGIFSITQASEGDVWITPTNQNVDASTNFDIEVHVDTGGKNLGGFNMYFDFTASYVTVDTTQGTEGVSVGDDASIFDPLTVNSTDITNGHLWFTGANATGINGNDVHIATIHAKTTSGFTSGTTNLSLRVNELLDELSVALTPGTITGATVTYAHEVSIYRFFNKIQGNHFYTMSSTERDTIINNLSNTWNYEGITYNAYQNQAYNTTPLYRFFNTNTGFHFYTASSTEKDNIINNLPTWNYEGIAYYIFSSSQSNSTAVYRFFNKIQGNHFYTTSTTERDNIINNLSGTWDYEGIAYYVPS